MAAANSGSVGRGKRFGVVDRPARTHDNAAKVQWDLRLDPNRPAQTVANAPKAGDRRTAYISAGRGLSACPAGIASQNDNKKGDGSCEQ